MTDITVTNWKDSPIHRAAYVGDIDELKRIFAEEGYPHYNIKDEDGITPLHIAAQLVRNQSMSGKWYFHLKPKYFSRFETVQT